LEEKTNMAIYRDPNPGSARSNTAAGGSADPQPRNSENVRSKQSMETTQYNPDMSTQKSGRLREIVRDLTDKANQRGNANRVEEDDVAKWAQGEVTAWADHIRKPTLASPIPLEKWLTTRLPDLLSDLDQKRAAQTKQNIYESEGNRDAAVIGSGYEEPAVPRRGMEDVDVATSGGGTLPPKGPPSEAERAVQSFRSEHRHIEGLEAWARQQLKEYRQYLRAFGSKTQGQRLTAKEWLQANFRSERGGLR
jgi:hypothetical protein